jgi:hypothetical protein
MATVNVQIDASRIARRLLLPGGIVDRDLRKRAEKVAARARQTAPGGMRNHISVDLVGSGRQRRARVIVDHPAAVFVAHGTPPHVIRPRRARALRFTASGRVVFATRVNHPGTRPNPFLLRALEAAR